MKPHLAITHELAANPPPDDASRPSPQARRGLSLARRPRAPLPRRPPPSQTSHLLAQALKTIVSLYFVYVAYQVVFEGNLLGAVCGTLVIICSLAPAWIWLHSRVKGFPIMPLFSGTFSYTYGLQFLSNRDVLSSSQTSDLAYATMVLCSFLLVGCAVWKSVLPSVPPPLPLYVRMMGSGERSVRLLLILFGCFTLYNVASAAGWIFFGSLDSAARLAVYGFGPLSTFALSYLLGQRKLRTMARWLFLGMFAVAVMASASSLILITSYSLWFLSIAGYTLGSRRFPWRAVFFMLPVIVMLQYGKYAMRETFWKTEEERYAFKLPPSEYAAFYSHWMELALSQDYTSDETPGLSAALPVTQRYSLLARSSLLQQFLLIHQLSPKIVPFMNGVTYSGIWSAILPRFFFPDKMSSLESTNLISIYYGLQSREDTGTTTIGWGLFNESFANYGFAGVIGLAIVAGLIIGWATRYTLGYPLLSAKGLFAIIMMNNAIQSEYTSATFAACLFQAVAILLVLSIVAMQRTHIPKEQIGFSISFERPFFRKVSRPRSRREPGETPAP